MTVSEANAITESVLSLRQSVYNTDLFMDTFIADIRRFLDISELNIIRKPDNSILVMININNFSHDLFFHYHKIINNALIYAIKVSEPGNYRSIGLSSNLANIVYGGSSTIIIEL